jgi:small subunit ribosomal protein S20
LSRNKSAEKRVRQAERRRQRNRSVRSLTRGVLRQAEQSISSSDVEAAKDDVAKAVSMLDRAAKKGVLHPNNAARRKSRLMKKLNAASSPAPD